MRLTQLDRELIAANRPGSTLVQRGENWVAVWKEGNLWVANLLAEVDFDDLSVWWAGGEISDKQRGRAIDRVIQENS